MIANMIAEFYDRMCLQFQETWQAAHWISRESQENNFNLLAQIAPFEPKDRVLDLGCGAGDLYGFFQRRGLTKIVYEGIDVSKKMIDRAWEKFPKGRFANIDFMDDSFNYRYDFILASGPFNHKVDNQKEYINKNLEKMYSLTNKAFGVILTSKYDDQGDYLFGYDPAEIMNECLKMTPYVSVNHTALGWGFVVFVYNKKWVTT